MGFSCLLAAVFSVMAPWRCSELAAVMPAPEVRVMLEHGKVAVPAAEASDALLKMLGRLLLSKRCAAAPSPLVEGPPCTSNLTCPLLSLSWPAGRVCAALDVLTSTCLLLASSAAEQTLLLSGNLTFGGGGASAEQWCLCVWTRAADLLRTFCGTEHHHPQDSVGRR